MTLIWRGKEVTERMRRAQKDGINKTMSEAVLYAKRNHEWQNRTGTLEGSINIAEYAAPVSDGVSGTWGSRDVEYALSLEFIVPYLRPAADAVYPRLASHIRAEFRK